MRPARAALVLVLIVGTLALPLAVARQADDVTPTSDITVIESDTRLATEGRIFVGPYSRFQWHHPGPLLFYTLAPFYVGSGGKTTGLSAGALAVNLASLLIALWALARHASPLLRITVAVALGALCVRLPSLLVSPWNPHVPVLPLLALLVVTAAVSAGTCRALPVAAALASFIAQSHVGLLPIALAMGAMAVAGPLWHWQGLAGFDRAMVTGTTGLVVTAAWAPVVIDQVIETPGNLTLLWQFFSAPRPTPGVDAAISAWADMLSGLLRPDLYVATGGSFAESPVRWAEALALVQVAGLMVVAIVTRRPIERTLAVVLLIASGIGLWSALQTDRDMADHAVFWIVAIGALNLSLITAAAVAMLLPVAERRIVVGAPIAGSAAVVLALGLGLQQLAHEVARSHAPGSESIAAAAVADDVRRVLGREQSSRVLIRFDQDAWGMVAGVVLRLQKAGVDVRVEDDWLVMFSPAFRSSGDEPVVVTIVGTAQHLRLADNPETPAVSARGILFAHRIPRGRRT